MVINLQARREHGLPESSWQALEQLEQDLITNCAWRLKLRATSNGANRFREKEGKAMVGATGIEPMTSTVSR